MLTKEWIEKTIRENIEFVPGDEPATVRLTYGKGAGAIAQAAEEDNEALKTQAMEFLDDIKAAWAKENADLQAQVAVMAEVLTECRLTFEALTADGIQSAMLRERIAKTLSAAPKVVWQGEAVMGWDGTMPELPLSGDMHTISLVAGNVFDVLALAHEQGQDSEQGSEYQLGTLLTSGYSKTVSYHVREDEDSEQVAEPQQPSGDTEEMTQEK